jgi:uncharacterized membrane protein YraQ (UPF0718 family)
MLEEAMNDLQWIIEFVARNVWNVWPAFLISITLSVLIRALKLDSTIRSAFNKRVGLSVLLAAAVGAFAPFCSCTVIPVISGLLISGVPLAPVMAFWIASPLMDLEIFALSAATLGMPLAVARLVATVALSIGGGYLTLALTRSGFLSNIVVRQAKATCCTTTARPVSAPAVAAASTMRIPLTLNTGSAIACCTPGGATMSMPSMSASFSGPTISLSAPTINLSAPAAASGCGCGTTFETKAAPTERWWTSIATSLRAINPREFGRDVFEMSWSLGRWLVLAFVLEAIILLYVPQETIATVLGNNSIFAIPLAALIGIPMYLGNLSALPIVSGLLSQGMQPGAAIAFLIAGPVTTIPAMTAVWNVVERKVFFLYVGIGMFGAMIAGVLTNIFLG